MTHKPTTPHSKNNQAFYTKLPRSFIYFPEGYLSSNFSFKSLALPTPALKVA